MLNKKLAMTVAEMLLTMAILGVIVTLTTPVLYKNTFAKKVETSLRKAYVTMQSTLDYSYAEDPDLNLANVGGANFYANYMVPRLSVVYTCDDTSMDKCFPSAQPTNAVLTTSGFAIGNSGNIFYVDINGPEKPNKLNSDVYSFELKKKDADSTDIANWVFEPLDVAKTMVENGWEAKHL